MEEGVLRGPRRGSRVEGKQLAGRMGHLRLQKWSRGFRNPDESGHVERKQDIVISLPLVLVDFPSLGDHIILAANK